MIDMGEDYRAEAEVEIEGTPDAYLPAIQHLIDGVHTLIDSCSAHAEEECESSDDASYVANRFLINAPEEIQKHKY